MVPPGGPYAGMRVSTGPSFCYNGFVHELLCDRVLTAKGDRMLHFLWMCVIGLIAGALAKLIMPGKDPGGILVTMLLGIAGSLMAGFLGRALGWYDTGEGAGLIMSVIGAILLLAVYRMVKRH